MGADFSSLRLEDVLLVDKDARKIPLGTVGKIEEEIQLPKTYSLSQNYPNPFNPITEIRFSLPQPENVSLEIYNIKGQKVITLLEKEMQAGTHTINWDGKNYNGEEVASGVYFYRIKAGEFSETKKMLLLR